MPSGIEFLETLFAVSMIGGVSVLLNARYKAPELAFVTENADLTTIVTNDEIAEHVNFVERLTEAFPALAGTASSTTPNLPEAPKLRSRSEEHTSELQSLMRTSYAVFCL